VETKSGAQSIAKFSVRKPADAEDGPTGLAITARRASGPLAGLACAS